MDQYKLPFTGEEIEDKLNSVDGLKSDLVELENTIGGEKITNIQFEQGYIDETGNDINNTKFRRCGKIRITEFEDATLIYNNTSGGCYIYSYTEESFIAKYVINADIKFSKLLNLCPDTVYFRIAIAYEHQNNPYIKDIRNGLVLDVENINSKIPSLEERISECEKDKFIIFKYGMECSKGIFLNEQTGKEQSGENYDTSPFIVAKNNKTYTTLNARAVHFYDKDKMWLGLQELNSTSVDGLNTFTISDENFAYIRLTFYNKNAVYVYGICETVSDYEIVMFGDSIIGLQPNIFDIPSAVQIKTGYKTANCGYGGTIACTHSNVDFDVFSFHSLADAIYNEDFSSQIEKGNLSRFYTRSTNNLNSIDFSKVKLITVAYGANDWNFGKDIDNTENKLDITTYCGGLRYGIEKILTKYPNIQICLMSPLWKKFEDGDTDNKTNGKGKYQKEFSEAMKGVAVEYHLPYFDHYNIGINSLNHSAFLRDGAHPTYTDGVDLLGAVFANDISSVLR